MKTLLLLIAWISSSSLMIAGELQEENRYLGLLHKLQYVETIEDLKKLIPDCPPPHPDAGEDNLEIMVKTKLFGCDAEGEFNFHKGILVSHGFTMRPSSYDDAHNAFLKAAAILDSQVKGFESSVSLPTDKGEGDCTNAPTDRITIYLNGIDGNADYQLRLESRPGIYILGWGAQKVRPSDKSKEIEQVGSDQSATAPQLKSEGEKNTKPQSEVRPR